MKVRKIIFSSACILSVILLLSLAIIKVLDDRRQPTPFDRVAYHIDRINSHSGQIYLYKDDPDKYDLFKHINKFEVIDSFDKIDYQNEYIFVVVTKDYYSDFNDKFAMDLVDTLLKSESKIIVGFVDFPDFKFFTQETTNNRIVDLSLDGAIFKTIDNFHKDYPTQLYFGGPWLFYESFTINPDEYVIYSFSYLIGIHNDLPDV
ncbi:MAG: hypothetical protein LBU60_06045 [Clostridiales bacterium]|jgi:hypothetical protein|nr:hypothetical protein [Clostridiales bacterium]